MQTIEEIVWFLTKAVERQKKDTISVYLSKLIQECKELAKEYNIDISEDLKENGH